MGIPASDVGTVNIRRKYIKKLDIGANDVIKKVVNNGLLNDIMERNNPIASAVVINDGIILKSSSTLAHES
jgi:hypothetical protein